MSKTLGSLSVGAKIEVPVLSAYQSRFGSKIVFKIADKKQRLPVEFRNADYGKNHSVNVFRRERTEQQQRRPETIRQ